MGLIFSDTLRGPILSLALSAFYSIWLYQFRYTSRHIHVRYHPFFSLNFLFSHLYQFKILHSFFEVDYLNGIMIL